MTIQIACPHCAKDYNVSDSSLGKQVRCKSCHQAFTAEEVPTEVDEAVEDAIVG